MVGSAKSNANAKKVSWHYCHESTYDTSCIVPTSAQLSVTSLAAVWLHLICPGVWFIKVQHNVILISCFRRISVVNNILWSRLDLHELQRWCQPEMDCCKEMLHPFALLMTVFSWTLLCIEHLIFLFNSTSNG